TRVASSSRNSGLPPNRRARNIPKPSWRARPQIIQLGVLALHSQVSTCGVSCWTLLLLVLHSQVSTRGVKVGFKTASPIAAAVSNFASVIIVFPDGTVLENTRISNN